MPCLVVLRRVQNSLYILARYLESTSPPVREKSRLGRPRLTDAGLRRGSSWHCRRLVLRRATSAGRPGVGVSLQPLEQSVMSRSRFLGPVPLFSPRFLGCPFPSCRSLGRCPTWRVSALTSQSQKPCASSCAPLVSPSRATSAPLSLRCAVRATRKSTSALS